MDFCFHYYVDNVFADYWSRYNVNACNGDRHCPKCQAARQAFWIDDLMQNTLPVKHYHIVFTAPHQLNAVCLHNHRMYYDLLFAAVWNTLRSFGYSHFGVETGAVAVLHTWGQNLSLHPHVHCIVPAAGYTLDGRWKNGTLPVVAGWRPSCGKIPGAIHASGGDYKPAYIKYC